MVLIFSFLPQIPNRSGGNFNHCCSRRVHVTSLTVLRGGFVAKCFPPAAASRCGKLGCLRRAHWASLEYVLVLHRAVGFRLPRSPANLLPPPQLFFQTAAIIECAEAEGHGSVSEPCSPSVPRHAFGGGRRRSGQRFLSPFKKQEHGTCIRLSSPESISAFRLSEPVSRSAHTPHPSPCIPAQTPFVRCPQPIYRQKQQPRCSLSNSEPCQQTLAHMKVC